MKNIGQVVGAIGVGEQNPNEPIRIIMKHTVFDIIKRI